jgi:hypothetical protein
MLEHTEFYDEFSGDRNTQARCLCHYLREGVKVNESKSN